MANDRTVDQLNHLIEINRDAEAGFHTAAENIQNTEIQTLFEKYATQHGRFWAELQSDVERRGGNPSDSGTIGGAFHRGWLDVKSSLSGHSASSMLTACQTAEHSTESAYLDAIKANPTGQTHTILERQCQQIKGFSTRLTRLVGEMKDGLEFQKND